MQSMFRSLLYYAVFIIVTIAVSLFVLITMPFSRSLSHRIVVKGAQTVMLALKWICHLDLHIEGLNHVKRDETYVIVSNHQSAWETVAFLAYFPNATFVLKQELFWIPILGLVIWGIAPVAIRRSDGRKALKKVREHGRQRLSKGMNLILFPEGTRMDAGQLGEFKKGAARIAIESKSSVIPVVHNAGWFWPKSTICKQPGTVSVKVGAPISSDGVNEHELNGQLRSWMEQSSSNLPTQ